MKFADDFLTSKTTITAFVTIITSIFAAYHHQITWHEALLTVAAAAQTAFLRDAFVKSAK
jgi:hypothetical protein